MIRDATVEERPAETDGVNPPLAYQLSPTPSPFSSLRLYACHVRVGTTSATLCVPSTEGADEGANPIKWLDDRSLRSRRPTATGRCAPSLARRARVTRSAGGRTPAHPPSRCGRPSSPFGCADIYGHARGLRGDHERSHGARPIALSGERGLDARHELLGGRRAALVLLEPSLQRRSVAGTAQNHHERDRADTAPMIGCVCLPFEAISLALTVAASVELRAATRKPPSPRTPTRSTFASSRVPRPSRQARRRRRVYDPAGHDPPRAGKSSGSSGP